MPKNDDRVRRDLEMLGLELSATEDDKKKAFIKLALKLHPDRFNKNPEDSIKMKFHEVCKAYKRLTSDHCSTADWNVDKSDEIFFSLLADSLQHNSKAALYGLFSELPNHKSHFQNDNEYRCKEDALDEEEDGDTEFNRLITILTNRLQNGKSLPAGLTQDKISKLKEDFIKHKEASKKCIEDEKSTTTTKKPKPPSQVPVTKPKPKSKKQILAEQRRREKEMAKIAAELDEKRRIEEEKETAKKQLEEEKQKKLEEEQRRQEEERKRLAAQAKKRKEREDRERELRQQKENERLEKLKKQQEEELRRKEEEKKRKAEEKAAKSKALRETKEREEKEKQEQYKKQQGAKRMANNTQQQYQPQYQQYQQQQQKYPREVPPRFLRQMQQRQGPTTQLPASQGDTEQQNIQPKAQSIRKDSKIGKEETEWDAEEIPNDTTQKSLDSRNNWTENTAGNENWGKELSSGTGSLSDWGTVTEDWDAPNESNFSSNWTEPRQDVVTKEEVRTSEASVVGTIGSEVKSGKIPKKDSIILKNEAVTSNSGQFGVIGQPVTSFKDITNIGVKTVEDTAPLEKCEQTPTDPNRDPLYKDIIEKNTSNNSGEQTLVNTGSKNLEANTPQGAKAPKLTGWSGLDGFEPLPNYDNKVKTVTTSQPVSNVVEDDTKVKLKTENVIMNSGKNTVEIDHLPKSTDSGKNNVDKNTLRESEVVRESDEWGWTTASSKKTKQKPTAPPSTNKDANAWMSRSLKQLLDMGFKLEDAERALKENNGIIESAVSDLLSRADTTPADKLNDQQRISNRRKELASKSPNDGPNDNSGEKQNSKKGQSKITQPSSSDDNRQIKAKTFPTDKVDYGIGNKLDEPGTSLPDPIGTQSQPSVSMPNSSFLPTDLSARFSESSVAKSKPVGVIGSQLPGTSKAPGQNAPRSSTADDTTKGLLGSVQTPIPSLGQHHPQVGAPINQSLHQATFPSFGSDATSFPGQNKLHQILQQQGIPQAALFSQQQIIPPVPGNASKDPTFISQPLGPNQNPAPQQSKLLQWTQPINLESKEPLSQSEQNSTWSSTTAASSAPSATVTPIGAPVTVDPVSAKWGVIAAPRLSPTPSEFKPGVPWKPKAELERDDKKSEDSEKEEEMEAKEPQTGNVNGMVSATERPGVVRPPPGLGAANYFDLTNNDPPSALLEQAKVENISAKKDLKQWLSLTGLKPKMEVNSLRLFCQQYGIVLAYRTGQGSVFVCYESQSQAQDACKALNGRVMFDSNIVATLIAEEDVPSNIPDAKTGIPQAPGKPFLPSQFPGMQPPARAFWDTNGQIGAMNPSMPFGPPPMAGMPPGGMPPGGMPQGTMPPGTMPPGSIPPASMLGLGPHLRQWPTARSDPLANHSPFWPMNLQPQSLLNQTPGYGPWSTNNVQPVTAVNVTSTHAAVSPSTGDKLLPDGLFNATESM